MTLTEGFIRDGIFIDFGSEIMYGDDQCYLDYPCRFPTVGFQLMATSGLTGIVEAGGYEWLVHSTRLNEVGSEVDISVDPFNIQVMNKPESEDEEALSVEDA